MLFLLTGEVQTGKTRWLEALVAELAVAGVPCAGVLAPGHWVPSAGERADGNGYEKLGIDNVLLPDGERIPFARRSDLARAEGAFDEESQAARAELAWHISDDALARVNAHFDELADSSRRERSAAGTESKDLPGVSGLLIVDELGRLEIWRDEGLTSAVRLLWRGPSPAFPHALVVVRDYLVDDAETLLAPAWPEITRIAPDEASRATVLSIVSALAISCRPTFPPLAGRAAPGGC